MRYVKGLEKRLVSMESSLLPLSDLSPRKRSRREGDHPNTEGEGVEDFRAGLPSFSQALDRLPSAIDLIGLNVEPNGSGTSGTASEASFNADDLPSEQSMNTAIQYYFDHVNPAYPILHETTVRESIKNLYAAHPRPSTETLHTVFGEQSQRL